ncbi:MAG: glycoside hydrolase family 11 protein [Ruminococcus sp.]|uniref:glycoside hydrolase family 11 protein n=1 Tax=Ruminococcus sp. TaxID=41978 RepID=UPI0025F8BF64|nr:glycoside hydrolase family 11 protein [Ruminococcus sp.]MCR4795777.1 glycoside hydrolase family 11 protein [Ruminococcus sp.]
MKIHTKKLLSAMTAAALCTVNVSSFSANSDLIIDHNSSGVNNGFYYELTNHDEDGKAQMNTAQSGYFDCSWDNEEDFSAVRGWKFAAPVEYSKLGKTFLDYTKFVNVEGYSSPKGYFRFGIRVRNSEGSTFTILEIDDSVDGKSIIEKNKGYEQIAVLKSRDEFRATSIWGDTTDVKYLDAEYTIYSSPDKKDILCLRNEPFEVNNKSDEDRWVCVSDKLGAIAQAGCNVGDITDITVFAEAAYSKGDARIYISKLDAENMPELVENETVNEEEPITLKDKYDEGVRTGHYYMLSSATPAKMEVLAPSLFNAQWDSTENTASWGSVFQRGKKFEEGQSYKALSNSSIDYSLDADVEGRYFAGVFAELDGPQTNNYNSHIEMFIIDACRDWSSGFNVNAGKITVDGNTYDVYSKTTALEGSFKSQRIPTYYFVNRNAAESGTVSVKHELEPFVDFIKGKDEFMGTPSQLTLYVDGICSKGNIKVTKNEISLPEFTADNGEYEKQLKKVNLSDGKTESRVDNNMYSIIGANAEMHGLAGEKLECKWDKSSQPEWSSSNDDEHHGFTIKRIKYNDNWDNWDLIKGNSYNPSNTGFSGFKPDLENTVPWGAAQNENSEWGAFDTSPRNDWLVDFGQSGPSYTNTEMWQNRPFADYDRVYVDYNVDLGELTDESDASNCIIGGIIECKNADFNYTSGDPFRSYEYNGDYVGYYILVADKWDKEPGKELLGFLPRDPVELGKIEAGGAVYNAKIYYPEVTVASNPYIILTREESLKPVKAEDIPEKYTRYENTIAVSDIIDQLRKYELKLHWISSAGFTIHSFGNAGSAVINSAEIRAIPDEEKLFTAEDVQQLKDFILGKNVRINSGNNYDLNGDGVWDTYDLCLMRNRIEQETT